MGLFNKYYKRKDSLPNSEMVVEKSFIKKLLFSLFGVRPDRFGYYRKVGESYMIRETYRHQLVWFLFGELRILYWYFAFLIMGISTILYVIIHFIVKCW